MFNSFALGHCLNEEIKLCKKRTAVEQKYQTQKVDQRIRNPIRYKEYKMINWKIFVLILLTFHMNILLAQEIPLDDNPRIFDDQYKGCRQKMAKIIPGILQSEMQSNQGFKYSWEYATNRWKAIKPQMKLPKYFKNEYGIAVIAYTGNMYSAFNKATRDVGTSIQNYKNVFRFKAMHYYLTMAMDLLGNKSKAKLVYRGVNNIRFVPSNSSNGVIRFGQFTSSSEDLAVAKGFGTTSFFKIQTRYGINIMKFSMFPNEKEVLIPGYELFKVASFKKVTHEFTLISKGKTKSRFNCAYFKAQMDERLYNLTLPMPQ
ncbi:T-cell ecto-ADP-ribosyltransferase 1-like [Phyllobates terribilis]|uniref:T-cell ecto-ADP-ribosyltransferase 1-like n=1 Tax=Phyllobates terribilis TaxID=111132 RepID=UPI003CCB4E45